MPYQLSAEHEAIRKAVREFGEEEIRPVAKEYEKEKRYPEDLRQEAAKYDFVAPHIPEEYGGPDMDTLSNVIVVEELWRADPGVGGAIAAAAFGTGMLLKYGDEWMCEEWLPKIAGGDTPIATAISEPGHGSNVVGMETTAEKDDDEYVINGNKMWITNGTVSDVAIILAKTSPGERHHGITAFLTTTDVPGYQAEKIDNKLGIRAQDTAEIVLDDLRVPEENIVGHVDQGFYQLMEFFAPARAAVAGQAVGVSQAAFDEALEYAQEREQFGKPISEFQAIQHKLAEMSTKIEAARSLTYRAAAEIDDDNLQEGTKLASMAKLFASEESVDITDEAIQIFGGSGYVSDYPVERFFRDARITKIYEGTSEIQKNIIADQYLD
ncbi:acyl-CoA dehydrogenase family protein [Salinarchaeum sp. IM2453]|uniref:acyl-CoA dehydrogenase family protein n=1 Tax=Salinarchaeum sp. IM2453 TaxID=2862870 RepID=UPI001C82DA77|nr:acyl-CoA dehydrogenase family protein [Salinarchaeum sp. IM2453]QZA88006.1 acyl-CoA dehydrogenase family protein [Salinarchaeum sp. IM2453]